MPNKEGACDESKKRKKTHVLNIYLSTLNSSQFNARKISFGY